MLRLIIPKHVELNNFRLTILFNFLQMTTLLLLSARFFEARLWVRHLPIHHRMSADLLVKPSSFDRLSEVWSEKEGGAVCSSPRDFDFSWGGFVFAGHECLAPCGVAGGRAWPRCVHEMETHRREAEDQVFFVTQFEERRATADGGFTSSFAFVPLEEAHTMSLSYGYSVPYPWWPSSFSASQLQGKMPTREVLSARSDGSRGGNGDILTILLGSHGEVRRWIEPQPTLDISLPELLEMAGASGAIDTQNSEGGLGRITGLNIDIHIECFQSQAESLPGREDWIGPTCYARAERNPTKPWAAWDNIEALGSDGTVRQRLHHGVRVRVIMEGHVDVFDANSLFLQLTASLVFLSLPRQFMYFFINYAVGHLSTIYRGVLIEPFDVQMECARLTARLMSNSVTFAELEDVKPEAGKDVGCISRARVDEQLREVLRYRGSTLDDAEIAGVVHFCHEAVMHGETLCRRVKPLSQLRGAILERVHTQKISDLSGGNIDLAAEPDTRHDDKAPARNDPGVITIDGFSMCCAASSQLEFESFVRLFDKDRGVTILEQFFLPPKLRPRTLLLEGQECSFVPRGSLFNLHRRHRAEMDMLQRLRAKPNRHNIRSSTSSERPNSRGQTRQDRLTVADGNVPEILHTSPVDTPTTPIVDIPAMQAVGIPIGSPPTLDRPKTPHFSDDPRPRIDQYSATANTSPPRSMGSKTFLIGAVDVDEDDFCQQVQTA